MNIQRLLSKFVRERESAQDELVNFQEAFQKDAAHALSWGTSVFVAAGKERVYNQLIQFIDTTEYAAKNTLYSVRGTAIRHDPAVLLASMTDLVLDRVLHRAKYPPQSTSPTSNLMEQYEMAAWANALTTLNDYKSYPSSL